MAKHGMKSMQEYKVTIKSLSEQLGTTLSQIVDQKELVKCLETRLRESVERAAEEENCWQTSVEMLERQIQHLRDQIELGVTSERR